MSEAEKIAREIANEICNHTFIDPALPTWKAIIATHIAPLVQERDELKAIQSRIMKHNVHIITGPNGECGCPMEVNDASYQTCRDFLLANKPPGLLRDDPLKEITELHAQLERAKGALAFYASLQTYLGAISKFDGDYRDISDEFGIEYYLPGKLADATLAELSAKDSTERNG